MIGHVLRAPMSAGPAAGTRNVLSSRVINIPKFILSARLTYKLADRGGLRPREILEWRAKR